MRNRLSLLALLVVACALATGCANTQRKLGRGVSNTTEILRLGEFRRTVEQTALWESPGYTAGSGAIRGFCRSLGRTGIGIYEVVTCPFPPYGPVATDTFAPGRVYPDNYTPPIVEDSMFSTDTNLGFAGGAIAPMIPGSRFRIFDTH